MSAHLARPPIEELRADARAAARDLRNGEQALLAMIGELEREKDRASDAFRAIVRSLAAALEARDGYTGGHSDEVQEMAVRVAQRLELPPAAVEEVRTVALLHDVGKIGIPDGVLHKNGSLSAEEWELMRQHPVIGERILRPLPGMAAVADAVRHEHERWDGGGYRRHAGQRTQDALADDRVLSHQLPLLGRERAVLVQDAVRDPDLADRKSVV